MEITSIIIKPRITEKSQVMKSFEKPKMSFVVNKNANKHQIAEAFKALFGIKPKSVNVLIQKPAPTRYMNKSRYNFSKTVKIAFVTVDTKDFEELQKKAAESANDPVDESVKEAETVK